MSDQSPKSVAEVRIVRIFDYPKDRLLLRSFFAALDPAQVTYRGTTVITAELPESLLHLIQALFPGILIEEAKSYKPADK